MLGEPQLEYPVMGITIHDYAFNLSKIPTALPGAKAILKGILRQRRPGEEEKENMKRPMAAVLVVALGFIFAGSALAAPPALTDEVVVDRSTRSKILNDYALLTRDLIQRSWTTPVDLAVAGALKGKIRINYSIDRNGSLHAMELIKGSGNVDMDATLLQAIRASAPFPPFPDEVAARKVLIRANFIVADLPTLPVTQVDMRVGRTDGADAKATQPRQPDARQFIWGVPAGTAHKNTASPEEAARPTRPALKKYHWGMQ